MAKRKNGKQQQIPGTERKDIVDDIEKAAEAYRAVRDERMELTEQETELKSKLREIAKKHEDKLHVEHLDDGTEVKVYHCEEGEFDVYLYAGEPEVKVRKRKKPKDELGTEQEAAA